jgi:phage FluMu protein Com
VTSVSMLTERIRSEYLAMPGLKLTPAQARRLWPANEQIFRQAMDALVAEGFLRCINGRTYISLPRPAHQAAKADIGPRTGLASARCPQCRKLNVIRREQTITGTDIATSLRCTACGSIVSLAEISA